MKIFQRLFNKSKTEIERKSSNQYKSGDFKFPFDVRLLNYTGRKLSINETLKYYRTNPAVATCVDLIGMATEEVEPILYVDGEYVSDHDLIRLLNKPNGFETWDEFIGQVSRFLNITGNSYINTIGNYKYPPSELYCVNPGNISVLPSGDGYPDAFYVTSTGFDGSYKREFISGDMVRFLKDYMAELYQIKKFSSSFDKLEGDSPMNAVAGILEQFNKGIEHNTKQLTNGVNIPAWMNFRDDPTQEELDNRKKYVHEQLTGVDNAGRMLITGSNGRDAGSGVDFHQFINTNRDMQFEEMIKQANLAIYNRYHIPLPFITNEGATFSNIEKSVYRFYEDVVIPHVNEIFSGMTKFMIKKYKNLDKSDAIITYNPYKIQSLYDKLIEVLERRKSIGIETINELRSGFSNRKPIDGGDEIIIPARHNRLHELASDIHNGDE